MNEKPKVALIGAGSMGGALLRGWIAQDAIDAAGSAVFDPQPNGDLTGLCERAGLALNSERSKSFDAAVIAVKPQVAADILPDYAARISDAIIVSVMAGRSIASVSNALGGAAKVARAMPNLPASIGKGASGVFAPEPIDEAGREIIRVLMSAAGAVVFVESEDAIDWVTAISGSGPAYFFLLAEALADAGAALGLDADKARRLAEATLIGAGAVLEAEDASAGELRKAVTSPGGTTEAALGVFDGEDKAMRDLVRKATAKAAARAKELSD